MMVNLAFFRTLLNIYGKKGQIFWVVCLSFHFYYMQSQMRNMAWYHAYIGTHIKMKL